MPFARCRRSSPTASATSWCRNPSDLRLLAGLSDWPEAERKAARFGFLHPAARDLYVDWELTIEYQVLRIEGEGGLTMMTYHAEEGSPEYDAFVRLDS